MEYLKVRFSVRSINTLFVWLCPRLPALDGSYSALVLTESGHVRAIRHLTDQMGNQVQEGVVNFPRSQSKLIAERKYQCASCLARLDGWSSCSHPGPCDEGCILKIMEQKDGWNLGHEQIQEGAIAILDCRPSHFKESSFIFVLVCLGCYNNNIID